MTKPVSSTTPNVQTDEERALDWWDEYKETNPPRGQAQFYYKDNREYAIYGYLAGLAKGRELERERCAKIAEISEQGAEEDRQKSSRISDWRLCRMADGAKGASKFIALEIRKAGAP